MLARKWWHALARNFLYNFMPTTPASSSQRATILSCFFFSGAAGLIYQVAWAKSLALIFGSTVYAITTVLAVFLGGLAVGSDWIGRWSESRKDPILLYALLEIAVAAFGILSLANLAGVRALYGHAFSWIGNSHAIRGALRFIAAAIVLFPATFLMGGTLPVLSRVAAGRSENFGRELSFQIFVQKFLHQRSRQFEREQRMLVDQFARRRLR